MSDEKFIIYSPRGKTVLNPRLRKASGLQDTGLLGMWTADGIVHTLLFVQSNYFGRKVALVVQKISVSIQEKHIRCP